MLSQAFNRSTAIRRNSFGYRPTRLFATCSSFPCKVCLIRVSQAKGSVQGCGPRKGIVVVTRRWRENLVALQNANCTTVGREFDFGQALPDSTEQAVSELRCHVLDAVRIRLEERG